MTNRHRYATKMDQKKQDRLVAGIVQDRFPQISGIIINMTYYHPGLNAVLMERTVNIYPSSDAYFLMECMTKGCNGGGYDLTPFIKSMAKARKQTKKGTLVCHGNTDVSVDHASIDYEISIQYNKRSCKRSP